MPVPTEIGDNLTAKQREGEPSEPVPAVAQSAPSEPVHAATLDAPLAAHLDGTAPSPVSAGTRDAPASASGVPKRIVVDQPGR